MLLNPLNSLFKIKHLSFNVSIIYNNYLDILLFYQILTNAKPKESIVKMEEVVKTWSMATNVTAEQDSMEKTAKTTSTNV